MLGMGLDTHTNLKNRGFTKWIFWGIDKLAKCLTWTFNTQLYGTIWWPLKYMQEDQLIACNGKILRGPNPPCSKCSKFKPRIDLSLPILQFLIFLRYPPQTSSTHIWARNTLPFFTLLTTRSKFLHCACNFILEWHLKKTLS